SHRDGSFLTARTSPRGTPLRTSRAESRLLPAKRSDLDGFLFADDAGMQTSRAATGAHRQVSVDSLERSSRAAFRIALVSIVAPTTLGCSDSSDMATGISRHASRRSSPPAAGTVEEHDESDTEGENAVDPGNPNANVKPDAPSSPGATSDDFEL